MGDSTELSTVPGPSGELAEAWQEDLEANIARHRERADHLRAQLNKETAYVQSLERLLADAKKRRASRDETADFPSEEAVTADPAVTGDGGVTGDTPVTPDSEPASDSDSRDSEPVSPSDSIGDKSPLEADKPGFVTVIAVTASDSHERVATLQQLLLQILHLRLPLPLNLPQPDSCR